MDVGLQIKNTPPHQSNHTPSYKKNDRLSNFEALRLLCMIMVLNLHSFWGYNHGSGPLQAFDFFRESTSICAVDCFILISGYFGIKWKFKSIFNYIFQLFFYSVGIYLLVVWLGIVDWDLHTFVKRFACLMTDSWGFAITYLLLWFCSPALNALAEKTSNRELLCYIVVFFCVVNVISVPRHALFTYALVYLIGRWLQKIQVSHIQISAGLAYWIATILIFLLVYYLLYTMLHITSATTVQGWPMGLLGYSYSAPLVILQAVFLFAFFSKINFQNRFVNWCATSCFAIYLIHMHPTIKQIGYYAFTEGLYELPTYQHVLILMVLIPSVFLCSIMIDKVRIIISNECFHFVELLAKFIPQKWFSLYT